MLGRLLHSYEYSRTKERLASKLAGVILRITAKTRDNLAAKLLGRLLSSNESGHKTKAPWM